MYLYIMVDEENWFSWMQLFWTAFYAHKTSSSLSSRQVATFFFSCLAECSLSFTPEGRQHNVELVVCYGSFGCLSYFKAPLVCLYSTALVWEQRLSSINFFTAEAESIWWCRFLLADVNLINQFLTRDFKQKGN